MQSFFFVQYKILDVMHDIQRARFIAWFVRLSYLFSRQTNHTPNVAKCSNVNNMFDAYIAELSRLFQKRLVDLSIVESFFNFICCFFVAFVQFYSIYKQNAI